MSRSNYFAVAAAATAHPEAAPAARARPEARDDGIIGRIKAHGYVPKDYLLYFQDVAAILLSTIENPLSEKHREKVTKNAETKYEAREVVTEYTLTDSARMQAPDANGFFHYFAGCTTYSTHIGSRASNPTQGAIDFLTPTLGRFYDQLALHGKFPSTLHFLVHSGGAHYKQVEITITADKKASILIKDSLRSTTRISEQDQIALTTAVLTAGFSFEEGDEIKTELTRPMQEDGNSCGVLSTAFLFNQCATAAQKTTPGGAALVALATCGMHTVTQDSPEIQHARLGMLQLLAGDEDWLPGVRIATACDEEIHGSAVFEGDLLHDVFYELAPKGHPAGQTHRETMWHTRGPVGFFQSESNPAGVGDEAPMPSGNDSCPNSMASAPMSGGDTPSRPISP